LYSAAVLPALPNEEGRYPDRIVLVAERLEDLEADRLLALQPEGVQRVEQVRLAARGQLLHDVEAGVEVAVDFEDARSVERRLRDLPGGDLARGQQDERLQVRPAAVRRERGAGVARRSAGESADVQLPRHADADGHPAVLEAARGVHPLVFDPEAVDADLRFEAWNLVQRGVSFGERDPGLERKRVGVAPHAPVDAARLEVGPRRRVGVPGLQQAVAVVAGVPDGLEGGERLSAGDAGQPDAVVGDGWGIRRGPGQLHTHARGLPSGGKKGGDWEERCRTPTEPRSRRPLQTPLYRFRTLRPPRLNQYKFITRRSERVSPPWRSSTSTGGSS
jgi:hypothetical protein